MPDTTVQQPKAEITDLVNDEIPAWGVMMFHEHSRPDDVHHPVPIICIRLIPVGHRRLIEAQLPGQVYAGCRVDVGERTVTVTYEHERREHVSDAESDRLSEQDQATYQGVCQRIDTMIVKAEGLAVSGHADWLFP